MTEQAPPGIDPSVPHPARRYDYWLGGKDNYQADRDSGDAVADVFPTIRTAVQENRRFLKRAVRYLVQEAGIRQFLDIGTGLPAADNTHEVAQALAPETRVVYVDNDPIVLVHARALLDSAPSGATAYLQADLREPKAILEHPELRDTLDLTRPVALMLVAILHFLTDEDDPYTPVRTLVDALAPGSHLAVTHSTGDLMRPEVTDGVDELVEVVNRRDPVPFNLRTRAQYGRFFEGLELVPPGIVPVPEWRPETGPELRASATDVSMYGAIGRVP